MSQSILSLSVIIPVFNEEQRLATTFFALEKFLAKNYFTKIEIIFVNDGSLDKTVSVIETFKPKAPVRIISYEPNRGKGYAVAQGMLKASNDYALFCDADISTPFEEIEKFIVLMEKGEDVIIGTRKAKGALVSKPQSFYRRSLGRCYTIIADAIIGLSISDFTCGFKVFSRRARLAVFNKLKINRWSYDAEALFLAHKYGFIVKEVPVRWHNDENTRVRLRKDIFESFIDLLKIRLGRYD